MFTIPFPTADNHRHSYKRKVHDDTDAFNLDSVRMKKLVESKTEKVSTLSRLQFFVRMLPKGNSVVMNGFTDETVKSVLHRIEWMTGIPAKELRLIYGGKQLQREKSLGECGIENNSSLHLVAHLRSGPSEGCPTAWRIVGDMVSLIVRMCSGEMVREASIKEIFSSKHFYLPGFLDALVSSMAPWMLVTLYASPIAGIKSCAEGYIRYLLKCCHAEVAKASENDCIGVVLEFCNLLRRVGCDDPLYVSCRTTFTLLLSTVGVNYGSGTRKRRVLVSDVFPYFRELAGELLRSLSSNASKEILTGSVFYFTAFLVPLRNRIKENVGLDCSVTDGNCHEEDDPLHAEVVDYVRDVFVMLLKKMDVRFRAMEDCLAGEEHDKEDSVYPEFAPYLAIARELYHVSKLYDDAEEMFWRVLKLHRNIVSQLIVRFADRIKDHRWVLENKSVITFEARRHLAMLLFPDAKENYQAFHEMLIDRSQILAESFEYIGQARPESLRSGLFMEFKNEEATGPGVLREWFVMVCHAIFNPENALFVACPDDHRRFYPNPASKVHALHLRYFDFSGRIIALALMNKVQVGIVLDRVFFMQLAGKCIALEDIRDADPYLYRSCKQILEIDADFIDSDALGLTFVREVEELGCRKAVELCPGGKSLVVNSKNREKFVDLLIQNCFVTSISEQVSHFAKGFADILSNSKIQQFFQSLELEDLDWMLHGSENTISVEDWKAHTKYNGYKETDHLISWFWEIVGKMSANERKVLLFFWTSVKYLPVEGFRGLASRLYICRIMEPEDRLPSSHTCFYQLCFPPYSSKSVMQDRLRVITQEHIGSSFGTW
ncbi:hypothetical protein RJT34_14282 [Clitoria ternatea]|uniref:HECT-type E3 ubiquitin transferase n=1 Tax=Clitoria ternatea TaxID=43366 RepID=A0AAN9PMQ1_CLITE